MIDIAAAGLEASPYTGQCWLRIDKVAGLQNSIDGSLQFA